MTLDDSAILLSELKIGLKEQNIILSEELQQQLVIYVQLLHKWNQIHNLTAIIDAKAMINRHILDSLTLYPFLKEGQAKNIVDVGSGGGLPGMVLAICCREKDFVLLEAQQKKVNFLQHVILSLKLKNVVGVCERVEKYKPQSQFDWVVSRAYASLSTFVSSAGHLCAESGTMIAMKGKLTVEEKNEMPNSFVLENCKALNIPGLGENRTLVFIKRRKA